jgi:hypothetical protein
MTASRVVLTTSKISILDALVPQQENQPGSAFACSLKWRQGYLWVSHLAPTEQSQLPALKNQQWLQECLEYSSIRAVCLDPEIGEAGMNLWADTCGKAQKPIFLRLPAHQTKHPLPLLVGFNRVIDRLIASILLIVLSPLLLAIALLLQFDAAGSVFTQQWRVGARGRLFRIFNFQAHSAYDQQQARLGAFKRWLSSSRLDRLPQLLNVVRGEMSLIGIPPHTLLDVTRLERNKQRELRRMPGIIHLW